MNKTYSSIVVFIGCKSRLNDASQDKNLINCTLIQTNVLQDFLRMQNCLAALLSTTGLI